MSPGELGGSWGVLRVLGGSGGSLVGFKRVLGKSPEGSRTLGSGGSLVGLSWVLGKCPGSSCSEHQTEGLNGEEKTSW